MSDLADKLKQTSTQEKPALDAANNKPAEVTKENKEKKVVYVGDFRILNKQANPIERIGNVYNPKSQEEIECLEYQVSQGRVSKSLK